MKWIKKNLNEILVTVISGLIILIIAFVFKWIISQINFNNKFNSVFNFLKGKTEINNFIIISVSLTIIILLVVFLIKQIHIIKKKKQNKSKTIEENEFFRHSDTPSFFDERLCLAFPRIHDLHWIEDSKKATYRLSIFFNTPLKFRDSNNSSIVPICWTRDEAYSPITDFKILKSFCKVLHH